MKKNRMQNNHANIAENRSITIWLVDDNPRFTTVLSEFFTKHSDIACTKVFSEGRSLLEYLESQSTEPDIILLDINMPGISGIETLAQIKLVAPEVRVVMLTVNSQDSAIQEALELGASGYLLKSSSFEELVSGIHATMKGGMPLDPLIVPKVLSILPLTQPSLATYALSEREREIIQHVVNGNSTQQIAEQLFISEHTVRTHIKNIFKKLGTHTREQLVAKVLRERIVK
ncbi:MAG: response regulator transcription factor [Bacteroidetes bacterium]|nr:response regulator transcription factor [Bacteroidota bacterium]